MRAIETPLTIVAEDPMTASAASERTYRIPPTHVLISASGVTGRAEEYFPDPDNGEPHRWGSMSESQEESENPELELRKISKGEDSAYLPFGAGRHRCVGESFAYLQLCNIIAYMVNNFTFENPPGIEGVPATDFSSMITRPVAPTNLVWKRRSKN